MIEYGVTAFGGLVGGRMPLASLTTDLGGTTSIGANIVTTGAQTYNDAVVAGAIALDAGTGAIVAINAANTFSGRLSLTGGTVQITNAIPLDLGNSTGGILAFSAPNIVGGGTLTVANQLNLTTTTGAILANAFTFAGSSSLVINIAAPNGSTFSFAGGSTPLAPTVNVPLGSNIGVFSGGVSLLKTQNNAPSLFESISGFSASLLARLNAAGVAAAATQERDSNEIGTDRVFQMIRYGFAGEVGPTPPMKHLLEDDGVLVPPSVDWMPDDPRE